MEERSWVRVNSTPWGAPRRSSSRKRLTASLHHQSVLLLGLDHLQQRGALAIEQGLLFIQFEAVADAGDLAQADLRARFRADHDQVGQFPGTAPQIGETHQQIALAGLQGTSRQIDALARHAIGYIGQTETMFPQGGGGDLDAQLVVGKAVDHNLGDLRDPLHTFLDLLRIGLQIPR